MPFDPDYPFVPADPSQWWRTRALPRIIVHPNAPPNAASGSPAGSDGIDDWLLPGQAPGRIAPWSPGTDHFFPDDWIYPDNRNAPNSAAALNSAPPTPSPQPDAANPAISNRPAPQSDPFAAYWAMIPAGRLTALAWAPPIFPDAFGRFPLPPPAPAPRDLPPDFGTGGLLGGIPKMLAAQAAANDPWANGILGGIPKMLAAAASPSPLSAAGSRGILGALANLQPAPSDAQADAAYLPGWRPFLSPDPIGYQGGNPSEAYLGNDLRNRAGPTGLAPDQSPTDETFDVAPDTGRANAAPNVLLVNGDEEEEKEHHKFDALAPGGLTEGVTTSPKALPTLPPVFPLFPRALPPPTSAPQPSPPRASLPPSPSASPGAVSPPSTSQAANSPRPSGTSIGPAQTAAPSEQSSPSTLERLLKHLEDAVARYGRDGLTKNQRRSLGANPRLEALHKGERIDTFAKKSIEDDESLRHLIITPRFQFGPDLYDPINKVWYDITTIGQWAGHEQKYAPNFGEGTPLFYGDK